MLHHMDSDSKGTYRRVLESATAREAYFNTTQAHVFGARGDSEVNDVLELLKDHGVVYVFSADETATWPVVRFGRQRVVGIDQVIRALAQNSSGLVSQVRHAS